MLGAVPGDGEDEGPLAGLVAGDLHAVMQERTSSHLFEVRTARPVRRAAAAVVLSCTHRRLAATLPNCEVERV